MIAAFGFPTAAITPQDIVEGHKVIQMGEIPVQLHVMSAIDGVTFDEVWDGRQAGRLGQQDVAFIGEAEFVKNKRAAGRLKDLADIDALRPGETG